MLAFFSATIKARLLKHGMIMTLLGVYISIVGLMTLILFQGHKGVRNLKCNLCILHSCLDSCLL